MKAIMLIGALASICLSAKEPNTFLIKQDILSGDYAVKKVYEAYPVEKKQDMSVRTQAALKELADANIHVMRTGDEIQYVIPTSVFFHGFSDGVDEPSDNFFAELMSKRDVGALKALQYLVQLGEKSYFAFEALARNDVNSERAIRQAKALASYLGFKNLKSPMVTLIEDYVKNNPELPFWQVVDKNERLIVIHYRLEAGQSKIFE